jgi:hypothetical protein
MIRRDIKKQKYFSSTRKLNFFLYSNRKECANNSCLTMGVNQPSDGRHRASNKLNSYLIPKRDFEKGVLDG